MSFGTERRKRWYLVAAGHLAGASGLAALGVMTCVTPAGAANGPTDPTGPLDQQVTRPVADGGSEKAAGGQADMRAASGKADAFRARLRLDHSAPGLGPDLLGDAGASVRAMPGQPSTGPSDEGSAGATEAAGDSSRSTATTDPRLRAEEVSPSTEEAARVRGMIRSFEDRVLARGFESNRSRLLAAAWGHDEVAANSEASTDARGFGVGDSSARPDGAMDEGATAADGMAEHGKSEDGKAEAADGKAEAADGKAEAADGKAEAADGKAEAADGKAEAADGKADAADGMAEHGKAEHGKAEAADGMAEHGKSEDGKAEAADGKTEAEAPGDDLRRFLTHAGDELADGHGGEMEEAQESLLGRLSDAMGDRAADDSGDAAKGTESDLRDALAGAPDQDVVTGEGATTTSDEANAATGEESMSEDHQGGGFTR